MPTSSRLLGFLTALALAATSAALSVGPAEAAPRPKAPDVASVAVGSNPYAVAVSQSLGKAFVVNDGSVSVVSLLTHRKIADFATGGGQGQNAVALMRGNTLGYVTSYEKPSVAVFDTETHRLVKQIPVGGAGVDVVKANTRRGQRAYVSVLDRSELVGIQTSSSTVVQRVKLPVGAQALSTRPGGNTVWAGSAESGRIWVVDTATGKITKTIKVDRSGPVTAIDFAPGAKRAWVAGLGGVSVVDTKTGKTKKFLALPKLFTGEVANPGAVEVTGSGRYALVENSTFPDAPGRGQVTLVDTKTYKPVWRVTTGAEPLGLAVDSHRDVAYVANYADDTVSYFSVPD